MELLIIAVLLLVIAGLLVLRKRRNSADDRPGKTTGVDRRQAVAADAADKRFHAVSIRLGRSTCRAAAELEGERFLSNAAPKLPLPQCDAAECDCRFVHHDDRRSGEDRRDPFSSTGAIPGTGSFAEERRHGTDRRQEGDEYLF